MTGLLITPLFWIAITLGVFEVFDTLSKRTNRHPLCHPVLWSTPVLIALLLTTRTPYATYREATFAISFLLGPAVVGLAVPIWAERSRIRRLAVPIFLSLTAGAVTAIVSAVAILVLFGSPRVLVASIAPHATTTPVAMAIASQIGGIPPLAAGIVISGGVLGAMCATPLLNLLGVNDRRARGFAVGVSAHGIGSARAFQVDPAAGAMASLGMALNAVTTAASLSLVAIFL